MLGPAECHEEILDALIDFAFFEGELRRLEQALDACEDQAQADIAYAYKIRLRDRKHWKRFRERIKQFSQMRFTYTQLEPHLQQTASALPSGVCRLVSHLCAEADVEDRVELFEERLEVFEDLYEGASDRVADYHWYFTGHWLEITIILLLFFEGALMATDVFLRVMEAHNQPPSAGTDADDHDP